MTIGPMKRINLIFAVVWLVLMSTSLQADQDGLAGLMARLAKHPQRDAFFIEKQHASYLESPLTTQGILRAIPPDRLEKIITVPESIKQVIVGNRIIQSQNGVILREVSLTEIPVLAITINTLRAVVFGNIKYLGKTFSQTFENHDHHWSLLLVPIKQQVKDQIKSIRVSGVSDTISEFILTQSNGDFTTTRLYEHHIK